MDIVQAVSGYITKMVSAGDSAATGTTAAKMKILLLDNETVGLSPLSRYHGRMLTILRYL
jgi:vacuolar protein sorting-associated protein 45